MNPTQQALIQALIGATQPQQKGLPGLGFAGGMLGMPYAAAMGQANAGRNNPMPSQAMAAMQLMRQPGSQMVPMPNQGQ